MRERKQTRLKNYDYSQHGYYFVTICAQNREQWFGKVEKGEMILNPYGKIVNECWDDLPEHYAHCSLDSFVIMPNHVHGIIVIDNDKTVGNGLKPFPTHGLSEMIRGFKTFSSRKINEGIKSDNKFQWQKSFYDHIIRGEKSLDLIREYIQNNPLKWELDRENPLSKKFNLEHDRYWKEIYSSFREPFMNSGLQRRVKSDSSI
jgi:REP element-mobilizing transposase RayT